MDEEYDASEGGVEHPAAFFALIVCSAALAWMGHLLLNV